MLDRLMLLFALSGAPLVAPPLVSAPNIAPATSAHEDLVKVAIETSEGRITVALDRGHSPLTVANFLHYVDMHRYDGQSFYRAMPYDKGGLIQAGITSDARLLFKPVAHEPTSATGLHNVRGTLAMARLEPGSARSDFFILTEDIPAFDASATDPGFGVRACRRGDGRCRQDFSRPDFGDEGGGRDEGADARTGGENRADDASEIERPDPRMFTMFTVTMVANGRFR